MASANTYIDVSGLDFETQRNKFKNWVKQKYEFVDYDFEGSTISMLMDILTYNTYMNAFYQNMSFNEANLDSAQIRANGVSRAKHLNYIPRSARCSKAVLNLIFTPNDSPEGIVIPKYTKFKTIKNGVDYYFVTNQEYVLIPSDNGIYSEIIEVYEGERVTQTFTYNVNQKFYELLNSNIDTTTITVGVKRNSSTSDISYYKLADDINDLDSTSKVYFLQENFNENYDLEFGDGILGKKLENGNIITVDYIVTTGPDANGLQNFTNIGYSGHNIRNSTIRYYPSGITTIERSDYSQEKESLDSIKFFAPKNYISQNRLVVPNDYKTFILNNFSYVQSINVWGGEDHVPPIYGRIIITIKPYDGYSISSARKDEMITLMKNKNIMGIEPIIIDPVFIYVNPTIQVFYDPSLTDQLPDALYNKIETTVQNYEDTKLSVFGNAFYYSKFLSDIEKTDNSIISADVEIKLEKRFVPVTFSNLTYKLSFGVPLRNPYQGYLGCVTSTSFKIPGLSKNDLYLDDDGKGVLRLYYLNSIKQKIYVSRDAGTVNYLTGELIIKSLYITSYTGNEVRVTVEPKDRNLIPKRNQIILLSNPRANIINNQNNQILKSEILDVNGNLSPIYSNSIDVPVVL